jgi:hypothetical protein
VRVHRGPQVEQPLAQGILVYFLLIAFRACGPLAPPSVGVAQRGLLVALVERAVGLVGLAGLGFVLFPSNGELQPLPVSLLLLFLRFLSFRFVFLLLPSPCGRRGLMRRERICILPELNLRPHEGEVIGVIGLETGRRVWWFG